MDGHSDGQQGELPLLIEFFSTVETFPPIPTWTKYYPPAYLYGHFLVHSVFNHNFHQKLAHNTQFQLKNVFKNVQKYFL